MTEKFLNIAKLICAESPRFGPPPAISSRVGTPRGAGNIPCQGCGYHNDVGTPPLSIASDTRRSSHPRPRQCRTLARSTAPRTQSPVHSSARGVTQLHIKGVLRFSFLRSKYHTAMREATLMIKAITYCIKTLNSLMMGLLVGWAAFLPAILLYVAMSVVAYATAILSCCCLVVSVVHHPG